MSEQPGERDTPEGDATPSARPGGVEVDPDWIKTTLLLGYSLPTTPPESESPGTPPREDRVEGQG